MKPLRVMVLVHEDLVPPLEERPADEVQAAQWRTEYDVATTLRKLGHEVHVLGVASDLAVIGKAIEDFKPQIAFNLLEEFHGFGAYDQHVVSYLELMKLPYTGCNPRGLTLARDKALTKKIMAYHRINAPAFAVFPLNRAVKRPTKLQFPLLVKSITEHGSVGISQASIVHDDEKLRERVEFIHRKLGTYAIAEQYIEGRELYVSVMGNNRLAVFPIWEMVFNKVPEDAPRIATDKAKWDREYQKRWGIESGPAKDLPEPKAKEIANLCRRIFRLLHLSGYARIDLRMTPEGKVYLIEANPNPQLAHGEDFADSAKAAGLEYGKLLDRITNLGLTYEPLGLA
jgi:D-alanine-D-alanine ligase